MIYGKTKLPTLNKGIPGTILSRRRHCEMEILNMNMCLSLLHNAIWLFRFWFGDNSGQHNLQYSNDSDIHVNTIEVLTYVVCIDLYQLDNSFPRKDTFHIHTLYNTSTRHDHICSPTISYSDHMISL